MSKGITVSCNAYFAQLGTYKVGADALHKTADLFGIAVANPNTAKKLKDALPQASYGQGQVVASPFQLARVAATIANNGSMPYGRWITDESNPRVEPAHTVLQPDLARTLAQYMRGVVTVVPAERWRRGLCRSRAKPERPNWRKAHRTPGSSASLRTIRPDVGSHSRCWWKMASMAARPPRRSRAKSSQPHRS